MEDQVDEKCEKRTCPPLDRSFLTSLRKSMPLTIEGDVVEIIPEEPFTEGGRGATCYVGYSDNYLKVVFEGSEDLIGQLLK